jgi:hypothetical protein
LLRLQQENAALIEEINDLEARLAHEQELHEHAAGCTRAEYEELLMERDRRREDARKLAREIRYLQAKCQREAAFRRGLQFQKQYLLLMIGGMEMSEQATLRMLLDVLPTQSRRPLLTVVSNDKFRAAVFAIIAIIRMQTMADTWLMIRHQRNSTLAPSSSNDTRLTELPPTTPINQDYLTTMPRQTLQPPSINSQPPSRLYQRPYTRPPSAAYSSTSTDIYQRGLDRGVAQQYPTIVERTITPLVVDDRSEPPEPPSRRSSVHISAEPTTIPRIYPDRELLLRQAGLVTSSSDC